MKLETKIFTDKLGRTVTLRSPALSDAGALLRYLKESTQETLYLLREPEEVTMTLQQEEAFLQHSLEAPREGMLLALCDGELAGSCSLTSRGPFCRYAHRCEIAIALYQKYWGAGIGERMLTALLDAAKALGYEQAELEVIAGNQGAIALYEKLGFTVQGRLPNNMKYKDGTYADALWMSKVL